MTSGPGLSISWFPGVMHGDTCLKSVSMPHYILGNSLQFVVFIVSDRESLRATPAILELCRQDWPQIQIHLLLPQGLHHRAWLESHKV